MVTGVILLGFLQTSIISKRSKGFRYSIACITTSAVVDFISINPPLPYIAYHRGLYELKWNFYRTLTIQAAC